MHKIFNSAARLQEAPGEQPHIGRRESQLLYGEPFAVDFIDPSNDWAKGTSLLDGYTGWLPDRHLVYAHEKPTHAVICLMTNAYPVPDFKTEPAETFSFMSRMAIEPDSNQGGFVLVKDRGFWIPENHLITIDDLAANPADIVDTAKMFVDCPYGYGGRSASGIDCSALVQLPLQRNGITCPRDTDQQEHTIGMDVTGQALQRGDLVYFPGHVGIMKDAENIINATVRHMKVIVEPLSDLVSAYGPPTSIRRLTP